jgi:hypothetical protein
LIGDGWVVCCFERLDLTCRAPPREERSIIGLGELLDDAAFNLFRREIVPDSTQKMLDDDRPTIEIYELLPIIGAGEKTFDNGLRACTEGKILLNTFAESGDYDSDADE